MPDGALERYTLPCAKGTILLEEGQPGDRLFVIQSGTVQVVKRVGDARIVLAELGPGDCVGEMAVIDGGPRSADAIVTEDAVLVALDDKTFGELVRENGEVAARIMDKLSQRLRAANQQIESLVSHDDLSAALRLLRSLAGTAREDGCRALPAEAREKLNMGRADPSPDEAGSVWDRLRVAGIILEAETEALLAPEGVLDDYLVYLELKQEFDPFSVRDLSEITGLSDDEVHRFTRRVLDSHLEGREVGTADSYLHFLSLKQRFEYPVPKDLRAGTSEGARDT